MKNYESGLTLIEMLTAVSVLIIMGGTTYAVFNTAIKSYHRTQSNLLQAQRCRVAMDQLVTDLRQIQADTSDEMLAIVNQDRPIPSGSVDILSFVTLVKTDPDLFITQLNASNAALLPPLSDVRRVAYYVGLKVPIEEIRTNNVIPPPYNPDQETEQDIDGEDQNLALYRIVTTTLNPELVIESFMNSGIIPTVDENGAPIFSFEVTTLADGIINFDLMYIDAEGQPYETWDQTDAIPVAIQPLISVIDEDRQDTTPTQSLPQNQGVIPSSALTQSTMVYLPASANASSE